MRTHNKASLISYTPSLDWTWSTEWPYSIL